MNGLKKTETRKEKEMMHENKIRTFLNQSLEVIAAQSGDSISEARQFSALLLAASVELAGVLDVEGEVPADLVRLAFLLKQRAGKVSGVDTLH